MTFSVGPCRAGLLVVTSLMLCGCLPSASTDEEKEPHFLAGRSRVNTMDFKGAIESFEKALQVNPNSASAHFELGWLYDQKESDPAAAIYHYERYLRLVPNSPKADIVTNYIQVCKQQLAQEVSLVPGMDKQQRELEQLSQENRRLREELEKWRLGVLRQPSVTNQPAQPLTIVRAVPSLEPGQAKSAVAVLRGSNAGRPAVAAAASPRTHTVKAGETPTMIARRYAVKLDALMAANPTLNPRRMKIGQVLAIPAPQ